MLRQKSASWPSSRQAGFHQRFELHPQRECSERREIQATGIIQFRQHMLRGCIVPLFR